MRALTALLASAMCLACPAHATSDMQREARPVEQLIQRVETALPAVSKDGRTLELSLQGWMEAAFSTADYSLRCVRVGKSSIIAPLG